MDKPEVATAAYSELLRYSVAISVQLDRIEHWKGELKRGREKWTDASCRALFELPTGFDYEDFLRQLKNEHELPPKMHLKTEVQFLVIAVRNAYMMGTAIRWALTQDANRVRCVQAALSAFEKAVPDAVLLRHLHEHMEQFFMGTGDALKKLPHPEMVPTFALLDDDIGYEIGGKDWLRDWREGLVIERGFGCSQGPSARHNWMHTAVTGDTRSLGPCLTMSFFRSLICFGSRSSNQRSSLTRVTRDQ
jgi:hypothetical protein